MPGQQCVLATAILLLVLAQAAATQEAATQPDSARAQIRAVLRAYYMNLENQNWDALSTYVLSPKLLERRGAPGDVAMGTRARTRERGSSHAAVGPMPCPSSPSPAIDVAAILIDGNWAEVSVPRCDRTSSGVDEFRMLYFEKRWRFIYTDLFQAPPLDGE